MRRSERRYLKQWPGIPQQNLRHVESLFSATLQRKNCTFGFWFTILLGNDSCHLQSHIYNSPSAREFSRNLGSCNTLLVSIVYRAKLTHAAKLQTCRTCLKLLQTLNRVQPSTKMSTFMLNFYGGPQGTCCNFKSCCNFKQFLLQI